jgi:hypothetical protein
MERKIVLFCVLVLPLCFRAPAQGGFYETTEMLSASCRIAIRTWSEQNPNSIDLLIAQSCNGYLQGALDAFEFERVAGSQKSDAQSVCIPDDVKKEQVIRVFMKYSDDHPEELHKAAPVVVWEAMHQAFACAVGK